MDIVLSLHHMAILEELQDTLYAGYAGLRHYQFDTPDVTAQDFEYLVKQECVEPMWLDSSERVPRHEITSLGMYVLAHHKGLASITIKEQL